jgi:hypothetical protein
LAEYSEACFSLLIISFGVYPFLTSYSPLYDIISGIIYGGGKSSGSPWENGFYESFNDKLQDELLKRELFITLKEAKILVERWRYEYNHARPHSSLGYKPPAQETKMLVTLTL